MTDQAERLREMFRKRHPPARPSRKTGSRIIVVASGKGGVGKTNLVVNIALVLGQAGNRVIILDTDVGMANVDIMLDLRPGHTLVDVIRGEKELEDVILKGPFNVEVIPGGSGLSELVSMDNQKREHLISRFSSLEEEGSYILVDCSAGLSRDVLWFIAAADDLVMVTTPEPTAITDVYSIIKVVNNYRLHTSVKMVVNMVQNEAEAESVFRRIERVSQSFLELEMEFLGGIEYDPCVKKAVLNCYPYVMQFPRSKAAQKIRLITKKILQEEEELPPAENSKESGFFSRLFQIWR